MYGATGNLSAILRPVVEGLGYEWVGLEYQTGGRGGGLLRIYIDSDAGITLDDCSAVSHQISGVLDVEDPIHENYRLEISSPGLDRPLFTQAHFQRFAGHQVVLKFHGKWNGRLKLIGLLMGCENDRVLLKAEGEEYELPLDALHSARLIPEFSETER
jgi:ribosome maturation factor RimP